MQKTISLQITSSFSKVVATQLPLCTVSDMHASSQILQFVHLQYMYVACASKLQKLHNMKTCHSEGNHCFMSHQQALHKVVLALLCRHIFTSAFHQKPSRAVATRSSASITPLQLQSRALYTAAGQGMLLQYILGAAAFAMTNSIPCRSMYQAACMARVRQTSNLLYSLVYNHAFFVCGCSARSDQYDKAKEQLLSRVVESFRVRSL